MITDDTMMARQIALEEEMRSMGIDRYWSQSRTATEDGRETGRKPVRRLLEASHTRIVAAIHGFRQAARSGKAGKKHSAIKPFEEVDDDDLLAHLALRVVLDEIGARPTLTSKAILLGSLIEDELFYRDFAEQLPSAWKATVRKMEGRGNDSYKRASTRVTGKKLGVERTPWDRRTQLLIGSKLLDMVVETTGLVELQYLTLNGTTPAVLVATPETLAWIEGQDARLEWTAPLFMPCIVPPKPWTTPFSGGYHSGRVRRLALVKTPNRGYLHELAEQPMPQVYAAVNALQDTAWAVNTPVLAVMETLWEAHSDLGVVPQFDPTPAPNKPGWLTPDMTKDTMNEAQLAEFKEWKRSASGIIDHNMRLQGKRSAFIQMLGVARRFAAEEAFYYPYQLDFRGRVYPVPLYLHPQGNDAQRGLLQFANEVPINDEDGARWLAIHGAGLWGIDKVSFDERVNWVIDHEEAIIAAANDPLAHTFWASAEKPWQALAFCMDWAGFKREGYGYCSALPVQMDGTCNGLQNFSAILRDEIGGAAVNLIPSDKPQDIYQRVADLVSKRVLADCGNTELFGRAPKEGEDHRQTIGALARGWAGNVTRKVTKRPVMTLAYGAKAYGFKQMVFDDTVAPWRLEKPEAFPWVGNGWSAAEYMGGVIWDCVGQVVVAARQAMDWLQEVAKIASAEGLPVAWPTPSGLLVQQAYRVPDVQVIKLAFGSVRLELNVHEDRTAQVLDKRRQSSGVAPNWVHSLDAAHLMRTINAASDLGLRSFCFIHDSYGTHAGNTQALATILREEFVRMYTEHDVLAEFAQAIRAQLPEGVELPPMPAHGNLDLSVVLDSPFFFA